jgi:hypothetical protein
MVKWFRDRHVVLGLESSNRGLSLSGKHVIDRRRVKPGVFFGDLELSLGQDPIQGGASRPHMCHPACRMT